MTRALLRKQLLELFSFLFRSRKKGTTRSRAGVVGMFALVVFLYISVSFAFFGIGQGMSPLLEMGLGWLFLLLAGMLTVAAGTLGSVFTTYTSLYAAKDNEQLLSMPVPPGRLLLIRMLAVFGMSLLYGSIVYIPMVLVWQLECGFAGGALACQILLWLGLALLNTVLSCLLGYAVALIAVRVKNKSFVTVALTLLFLGAYYFVYFRVNTLIQELVANALTLGERIRSAARPLYGFGLAMEGGVKPTVIFLLIVAALFVLSCVVLTRSYFGILTRGHNATGGYSGKKSTRSHGVGNALLRRELKRFLACPAYMLNMGLTILLMPAGAVLLILKADQIRALFPLIEPMGFLPILPAVGAAAMCILCSMSCYTAPSTSLEGRTIWILQCMPVNAREILKAKKRMHVILCGIPTLFPLAALLIVLKPDAAGAAAMVLCTVSFLLCLGDLGLVLGVSRAILDFNNESIPVKSGLPVTVSLFGGWAFSIAMGVGAWLTRGFMAAWLYLLLISVLLIVFALVLRKHWQTHSAEQFGYL